MPETRASSGTDAVLTSTPTAFTQSSTTASSERDSFGLGQVVLVLADADRLRVDLDQLGQRVLQPAGDRDRAAQRDVQVGQLLRRRRPTRSRPTRRPRRPPPWSASAAGCGLISSAASLSVSREAVPLPIAISSTWCVGGQPGQRGQRLVPAVARLVRVDGVGGDHLAGGVDDGDLDAGAEARVEAHRGAGAGRRGEQQVAQVRRRTPGPPRPRPPAAAASAGRCRGAPGSGCARPSARCPAASGRPAGRGRRCRTGAAIRALVVGRADRWRPGRRRVGSGLDGQVEDLLLLAAEHRQDPVRGQLVSAARRSRSSRRTSRRPSSLPSRTCGDQPARASTSARAARRPGRRPRRTARPGSRARRPAPAATSATPLSGVDVTGGGGLRVAASGRRAAASASGSSPASRAICALVRRFGLYGR